MLDSCNIRTVTGDDLPILLKWRNHPHVRRFMFTQHEIGPDEHRSWFERVSQDETRKLLIVEERNRGIGYVQFTSVAKGGISDWGFYTKPNSPRGSGRKLGIMALCHAFGHLELHKVCGQAFAVNEASIAFHKRLGFKLEGVLREQQIIDGVYHDLHCFGLLAHEWQPEKVTKGNQHAED